MEQTVLALEKALYFMYQVRFGGPYGRRTADNDHQSSSSDAEITDNEELWTTLPQLEQRRRISPTVETALASCLSVHKAMLIPLDYSRRRSPLTMARYLSRKL